MRDNWYIPPSDIPVTQNPNLLFEKTYDYEKRPIRFSVTANKDGEILSRKEFMEYRRTGNATLPHRNFIVCPNCGKATEENANALTWNNNVVYWTCGCGARYPSSAIFNEVNMRADIRDLRIYRTRIFKTMHGVGVTTLYYGAGFSPDTKSTYPYSLLDKVVFNLVDGQVYQMGKQKENGQTQGSLRCITRYLYLLPNNLFFIDESSHKETCDPEVRNALARAIADYYEEPHESWTGLDMETVIRKIRLHGVQLPHVPEMFDRLEEQEANCDHMDNIFLNMMRETVAAIKGKTEEEIMNALCCGKNEKTTKKLRSYLADNPAMRPVLKFLVNDCKFSNRDVITEGMKKNPFGILMLCLMVRASRSNNIASHTQYYYQMDAAQGQPKYYTDRKPVRKKRLFFSLLHSVFPNETERMKFLLKLCEKPVGPQDNRSYNNAFLDIEGILLAAEAKGKGIAETIFRKCAKKLKPSENRLPNGDIKAPSMMRLFESLISLESYNYKTEEEMKTKLAVDDIARERFNHDIQGLSFRVAETGADLYKLGMELHNCVSANYFHKAKEGGCYIVGAYNQKGRSEICIEVSFDGRNIWQKSTYCNHSLDQKQEKAFDAWEKISILPDKPLKASAPKAPIAGYAPGGYAEQPEHPNPAPF